MGELVDLWILVENSTGIPRKCLYEMDQTHISFCLKYKGMVEVKEGENMEDMKYIFKNRALTDDFNKLCGKNLISRVYDFVRGKDAVLSHGHMDWFVHAVNKKERAFNIYTDPC